MRIGRPLLKLPIRFDGEALAREVLALPQAAWLQHPEKFDGNTAVPLVSPRGAVTNEVAGPMGPTQWLSHCPYIVEIMRTLDSTWGRSRLMGLAPGAQVQQHVDVNYYWRTHLRVHIPVVTNPGVAFTCDGETVHLAAGECWLLDSFYQHSVENRGSALRIHLVLDTVGSGPLWDLLAAAQRGGEERFVAPGSGDRKRIVFEQINWPLIMSPWEIKAHIAYMAEWTAEQPGRDELFRALDRFVMAWEGTWACHGVSEDAVPVYIRHLQDVQHRLAEAWEQPIRMRNGLRLREAVMAFILGNAIAPAMLQRARTKHLEGSPVRLTA